MKMSKYRVQTMYWKSIRLKIWRSLILCTEILFILIDCWQVNLKYYNKCNKNRRIGSWNSEKTHYVMLTECMWMSTAIPRWKHRFSSDLWLAVVIHRIIVILQTRWWYCSGHADLFLSQIRHTFSWAKLTIKVVLCRNLNDVRK